MKTLSEFIGFPSGSCGEIEGEGSDRFGGRLYTERSSEARRYFLLEGRTVRVLGGRTLEGSGEDSL